MLKAVLILKKLFPGFDCILVHTDEKNSNASVGTEALHHFGKDMEFVNLISLAA